jgi:hypothetical protein
VLPLHHQGLQRNDRSVRYSKLELDNNKEH